MWQWQNMMGNAGICGGVGQQVGGGLLFGGIIVWLIWLILSLELMIIFWYLIAWLKKK